MRGGQAWLGPIHFSQSTARQCGNNYALLAVDSDSKEPPGRGVAERRHPLLATAATPAVEFTVDGRTQQSDGGCGHGSEL
jgi:hypothetical protein